LENDLELSPAEGPSHQLIAVTESLVSPDLEVREKALDGLVERDSMLE
jgi:hypothetical protein